MAEKAGGSGPFVLTEDMRVDTPLQLTPEMRVPAEEAPVNLGGIPSRLTLTGAESLGPTTPDLSGIASRLNLSLPETPAIPADPASETSLAGIDTTMAVGDTVGGLSVSDTFGSPISNQAALYSLEVRGQKSRPFFNPQGGQTSISEAPIGEPVYRIVVESDGNLSVQVGSRIEDPNSARDNFTSASMVIPGYASKEQQKAALDEVMNTWKQNYEGITSSDQITQGAAKVQPMNVDAITTKMDSDAAATDQTAGFTTARGSTYTVNPDGTTTRTRAPDEEGGSFVEQPTSGKTIFMSKEDMNKFGPLFQQGELGMYKFVPIEGTTDQAQLVQVQDYGPFKAGDPVEGTQVTFSTTPEVGQHPVEIYDSTNKTGNDIHFGSEITELTGESSETPVFTSVRETTETPVFTSVREGTPTAAADAAITSKMDSDAAATQEEDVAAVVELPEEFQEQLELPLESDQTKALEEDQTKALEEDQTKALEEDQTKALEEDQTKTLEEEQQTTTVVVPTITQIPEPGEDEEVEVELEPEEPEVEPEVTTEVDEGIDVLVPPITSTDDDGNTITECPEGYELVQTADGPMCQKSVSSTRQRAGASTRAYTGLSGNVGRRGPGQKRKTTTTTQRVRPTIRSA